MSADPWPLTAAELDGALDDLESGRIFKEVFEGLLFELPIERARVLMLLHREGRAGWLPLAGSSGGAALCIGNALSGSWVALARAGFTPTLLDSSLERARFGALRIREAAGVEARCLRDDRGTQLPFADLSFELAVFEPSQPSADASWSRGPLSSRGGSSRPSTVNAPCAAIVARWRARAIHARAPTRSTPTAKTGRTRSPSTPSCPPCASGPRNAQTG